VCCWLKVATLFLTKIFCKKTNLNYWRNVRLRKNFRLYRRQAARADDASAFAFDTPAICLPSLTREFCLFLGIFVACSFQSSERGFQGIKAEDEWRWWQRISEVTEEKHGVGKGKLCNLCSGNVLNTASCVTKLNVVWQCCHLTHSLAAEWGRTNGVYTYLCWQQSGPKMETLYAYETSVSTNMSSGRYTPEDKHRFRKEQLPFNCALNFENSTWGIVWFVFVIVMVFTNVNENIVCQSVSLLTARFIFTLSHSCFNFILPLWYWISFCILLLSRFRLCHYSVGGAWWHLGFYESF
jgi:hypothetical protein